MTSIFNTVETASGKANRIINFLSNLNNKQDVYIALGKPTPWTTKFGLNVSDINPPTPSLLQDTLPEPIVYVKAKAGPAVKKIAFDSLEPIFNVAAATAEVLVEQSFNDTEYQYLDYDSLFFEDGSYRILPQFLYITGRIAGENYTEDSWRASALFTNLKLAEGVAENKNIYLPEEVTGGIINQITFNTPVLREDSKSHTFEYLINL